MNDVIVLLARQRSGTNALRSVLETHPDIHCFNEVFSLGDRESEDPDIRDANFFNFLVAYAGGDVTRLFPDRHEQLFLDFLEYLRCFSSKRYVLIDVKYNTTHFLQEPWQAFLLEPFLFRLIRKHRLRVAHLTRRNYLRFVLSTQKSWRSGQFSLLGDQPAIDGTVELNVDYAISEFRRCQAEDELVISRLGGEPTYRRWDYADAFGGPDGALDPAFLAELADWLGIDDSFANRSEFKKQSFLPLSETLIGYERFVERLTGTEFEHLLDDEPMYRASRREVPA